MKPIKTIVDYEVRCVNERTGTSVRVTLPISNKPEAKKALRKQEKGGERWEYERFMIFKATHEPLEDRP